MKAVWNGTMVVESEDTVEVEGSHYFPVDAVRCDLLRPSLRATISGGPGAAAIVREHNQGDETAPTRLMGTRCSPTLPRGTERRHAHWAAAR